MKPGDMLFVITKGDVGRGRYDSGIVILRYQSRSSMYDVMQNCIEIMWSDGTRTNEYETTIARYYHVINSDDVI